MSPELRQHPAITVIGLSTTFISIRSKDANNFPIIPELWDRLISRIGEIPNKREYSSIGLCMTLPDGVERTHPDEYYYVAAIEVDAIDDVPEGMEAHVVPPASYRVFTHRGPIGRLGETIDAIYEQWLPNASETVLENSHPVVEVYDERFDGASENSVMEVWVPVAARE